MSLAVIAALAANAAHAGPLAPAPRVVATYDRNFIERSGAQTLDELLDTGIIRYFLTGGQSLLVLVNGRPYATTGGDLEALPLSAVERIEVLGGDSLGTLGAATTRGALNIVLRKDLDGFETRTVTRAPSRDGGDAWQGSVFWGGAVGKGRMTLGADIVDRQEIPGSRREHSRSEWVEGGTFSETRNVSVSGNTAFVVKLDSNGMREVDQDGDPLEKRSVALGECDPARGYVPGLSNPPGITSGDKGCGFAYGDIWWDTRSREQKSAILNLDHPLGDDAELHLDANITQNETALRYAPSVDVFTISLKNENGDITNQALLNAINAAARVADPTLTDDIADDDDRFSVGHRFVGHGNRHWVNEGEEYDISLGVEGRLAEGLGYDARIRAYRWDSFESGVNLVHAGRIQGEIAEGRYDVVNPFPGTQATEEAIKAHSDAIEYSRLREELDSGAESLSARLALEGSGFAIGGRDAAWTAGVELGRSKSHSLLRFRSNDGMTHKVTEVLGSGGVSYAGERETAAAFGEVSLPLADRLDLMVAGRGVEFDDVGGLESWRLGGRIPGERHCHAARLLGRGRGCALDGESLQHRGARPPLHSVRPGARDPAAHLRGAERPAGDARGLGQPAARSFGLRAAHYRRRGPQGAVLPGRGMVSALGLRRAGAEHRHLGHAEPGGMRGGRRQGELHRTQWRRYHHPPGASGISSIPRSRASMPGSAAV